MLNRHGFSLHSAGVTGGSPEQLTITFFRGVSLKDLLDSVNPGRGYHLLRAVPNKIQRKEVLIYCRRKYNNGQSKGTVLTGVVFLFIEISLSPISVITFVP